MVIFYLLSVPEDNPVNNTVLAIMEDDKTVNDKKNESVKRCRDKKRKEEEEVRVKSKKLKEENAGIVTNIKAYSEEKKFMVQVFKAHLEAAGGSSKDNPDIKDLERILQLTETDMTIFFRKCHKKHL